jgi:(4-alkanoyl-5-oxo-2,5-dihydrofuran-3-yl)methyl phosphate reductase
MILVTGATGTVGRKVVDRLLAAGEHVRALTRDPGRAEFDPAVEVVAGDMGEPSTLPPALAGVDRVFLVSVGGRLAEFDAAMATAARAAGVRHIVKLSVIGAVQPSEDAAKTPSRLHVEGENAVRGSGVEWTFLRPGPFMTNALNWAPMIKKDGVVRVPFGHNAAVPIDPEDVAAVAARVLTSADHAGVAYPLSGPEVLSPAQQVEILAAALRRELDFVDLPEDAARQGMVRSGMPEDLVEGLLKSLREGDLPHLTKVFPTVQDITGEPPRSFDRWVADHLDSFH